MTKAIGIDLGSANSVMAYMEENEPKVIANRDGALLTPSVVHILKDGEPVVGKPAKNASRKEPEHTVFSVKRFIGRQFTDAEVQHNIERVPYKVVEGSNGQIAFILRGRSYTPIEISALILKAMKRDAEAALGEDVTHAVITVPAYFTEFQRHAIQEANYLAGLNVLKIVDEPIAAAFAYGFGFNSGESQTVLVYDLGAGIFDVAVVHIDRGMCRILSIYGDMHLGGGDFDREIVDWLIKQVRIQHNVDIPALPNANEVLFTLERIAEQAKILLSTRLSTEILIPGLKCTNGHLIYVECKLTRDEFNDSIQPYVDRSVELVYEAIRWARITLDDIETVLLIGGSTYVPLVKESLRRAFGDRIIRDNINPMHCVAKGAAILTLSDPEPKTEPTKKLRTTDSMSPRALRVFLCHSSGDKPTVRDLYHRLRADGVDPWLDEENLLPGQDWQQEIRKAVRLSDVVVVCLSRESITKAGYVQKEIRYALDVSDEQPEGTIFLIPLKLEECEVPERLRRWQWVNFFEEGSYDRLMRALQIRASTIEATTIPGKTPSLFRTWHKAPADLEEFSPYLLKEIDRVTTEARSVFAKLSEFPSDPSTNMEFMKYINGMISKVQFDRRLDIEVTCLDENRRYFVHPWFPNLVGSTHASQWTGSQGTEFIEWFWMAVQEMKHGYLTWTDSLASDPELYIYVLMGREYRRKTAVSFFQIPIGQNLFWTVAVEGHEVAGI